MILLSEAFELISILFYCLNLCFAYIYRECPFKVGSRSDSTTTVVPHEKKPQQDVT